MTVACAIPAPPPLRSLYLFAACLAVYFCLPENASARDLIYAFPLLFIAESLASGRADLHRGAAFIGLCFLALWLPLSLPNGSVGVHEALFVAASLLVLTLHFETPHRFPIALLIAGGGVALVTWLRSAAGLFAGFDLLRSAQTAGESSLGLALPLVAIHAWASGRRRVFLVSLLLSVLMFKRIALLALAIVIVLEVLQSGRFPRLGAVLRAALIAAVFLCGLNSTLVYEHLSALAQSLFGLSLSPDEVSSGRYFATLLFQDWLGAHASIFSSLVGHGPGFSTRFLTESADLAQKHFPLLHNDILRLHSDYGFVGLVGAFWAFQRMARAAPAARGIATYTALIFLTDNVLTYFYYWVIAIALLRVPDEDPRSA
ncbi:hypothetical protein LZA78_12670 [Sinirhodobacter sp. WL0062]|uniref:O-antigen ligase domain-containing protein n=1 Tax=Rhodobacter flavimaris TaxID=2907145 RepID=A0ABS8YYZ0_9RHOB|nr:hypothetical protein [Sinirhodobacter sp. WL0062]MCE5974340.1 hypothetical protein [Sinirhodobacter sp. WL0062]